MEFADHMETWAMGDSQQGKIMLFTGILLLIGSWFIFKSDNALLRGTLIPVLLVVLIGIGYGGFLSFSRMGHAQEVAKLYEKSPAEAVQKELIKAERDFAAYTMIQKVWPALIMACCVLLYFFQGDYFRGVLIGLIGTFLFGMMLDSYLHHRLAPLVEYLRAWSAT